jgi:hypothetical protein
MMVLSGGGLQKSFGWCLLKTIRVVYGMNMCIPIEPAPVAYRWGLVSGRSMIVRSGDGFQKSFELVPIKDHKSGIWHEYLHLN